MDRRRKISIPATADDDKNDRITTSSTEYFPAENNLNYSHHETAGTINKNKNTEMVPLYNLLSEDMRISKILRRLSGENNTSVAINLCKKLEIAARNQSNLIYIRRALDFLCESIITILRKSPIECLNHVANVFGIFGYIARDDFPIYKNWLFKNYDNYKDIRVYLMRSLKVTFREDSNNRELGVYSNRLFLQLKNYLESAEAIDEFIAISDCIAEFSINYKKSFEKHFMDIVDIIVGWHLETDYHQIKTPILKQHCSKVLQTFSDFFVRKLDFTLGLLRQFLEDISVFGDEIDNSIGINPEIQVGSFIGALNTVIKCLVNEHEIIAFKLGQQFFNDTVQTINRVAKLSLQKTTNIETVQSINEFYILIIQHGEIIIQYNPIDIFEIIQIQENNLNFHFDDEIRICSLLYLILILIQKLKTSIPIELIGFILGKTTNSFGLLKFTKNVKIYKLLLKIYHEILTIKNVPLLQEAYKNILFDTRLAKKNILYNDNYNELHLHHQQKQYTYTQAECVFNFYLSALSILATQTSSIIGMYALQPSLLELLLMDFEASNIKVWLISPVLHNSLINFLMVHCKKNHNYLLSSNLLTGNHMFSKLTIDDVSPTSENFSYILKFHMDFLINSIQLTEEKDELPIETFNIILKWLDTILLQCAEYSNILKDNVIIQKICLALCEISSKHILALDINLLIVKCINTIIINFQNLNIKIFDAIYKVCCIQMCSTNIEIRSKYSDILGKLPLSITLLQPTTILSESITTPTTTSKNNLNDLRHLLLQSTSSTFHVNIRDKYFKLFIDNLGFQSETDCQLDDILIKIFTKCWQPIQKRKSIEIYQNVVNNLIMLIHWIQTESGQYCVNNKLRTALGKPQDTFLKIEAIIKEYARILALKDYAKVKNVKTMIANQKNARILLGFLEYLEKSIYNASDGTAFSMITPEKPARIFFRVNISTCKEWFKRIRNAINLIGLHCSEPEMVIRYSEDMLKCLIQDNKINDPMYNHSLISFVLALIKTGESETLNGLYMLIKLRTGKRYAWIKCAAEQSSGHYEKAADGYINVIKVSSESMNFDKNVRDFVNDQLIECLYLTRQWDQLKLYLDDSVTNDTMLTLKTKQIDDIIQFENTLDSSVINLSNWEQFDNLTENLNNNFSYQKLLSLTENTLINLIIQPAANVKYSADSNDNDDDSQQLERCKLIIQSGIQESFRTGSTEYLNNLIILSNVIENITYTKNKPLQQSQQFNNNIKIDKANGFLALTKIKRWSDYFYSSSNRSHKFVNNYDDLHMNIISLSRKYTNYKLCETELQDFFRKKEIGKLFNGDLKKISEYVQQNVNNLNTFCESEIRGLCETSKWLFSQNGNEENGIQLAACCTLKIIDDISTKNLNGTIFPEKGSRMLLNLSDWVAQHPDTILSGHEETPLKKLIINLPEIVDNSDHDITSVIPVTDMVVGKLIQASVRQSSSLAKAWSGLGNWYYRWGRKIIEAKTDINAGLSDKDIESIKTLITTAKEDDLREIVDILNKHHVIVDDEEIDTNEQSSTDLIEQQLRTIQALQNISSDIITAVIGIWRQAHKSKSLFYEKAADAYFKYLNLATSTSDDNDVENYGECVTITATLRLLRLVVKHAFGLQDVLEDGLSTTPTRPWKAIIPQLFSRLNHHEQYVRKRVSELLCRVAKDSPHLIIFPAVVGAAQKTNYHQTTTIESNEKELSGCGDDNNSAPLTLCFNSLLDTLYTQTPETVEQVQLLERELKRISLLWDEFWLHSLAQIYSEYSELFNSLENEIRKYSSVEKINLLKAKHKILIDYIVNDLQRLHNITSRPPETNNEKQFQEKYTKLIESTIESLQGKPLNMEKPNESWQKIKQLYSVFQQKFQRNVQTSLKMSDISPVLANLKNTSISMPGVETIESKPIYIRAVDNTVNILPTKTKPKKLALYGSDGRKYTYLFKGLEDLHLDERIMQFLSISNSMMSKSSNDGAIYRAHYYSVIPLGPQSGLISWVDEMTPLFALYKKWQQRESVHPQIKKDKPFVVMRPSEMFYKKLTPLLAEQNIKTTDNRKTWPLSTLRKVLTELTQETPKDLLAKELWCHSNNATEWRQSIRNYSRSVAVMSVIGYVIGLGDRHLDNVLVKLSTGNIVHIDYNVCFEKGKTLRVPERVPFRMTPNLEEALGITGIEGIFRLTCEHVLKTLRKEREILLTLLEAFVYDPLVDWAVNDDGTTAPINSSNTNMSRSTKAIMAAVDIAALGTVSSELEPGAEISAIGDGDRRKPTKKKLENDDIRTTLKTRFAEIKPEWTQYKNDLTVQLKLISDSLNLFELKRRSILENENKRDYLSKQLSMVQEIDSLGTAMESHALNTVSQRYGIYKKTLDEFNEVQKILNLKLNEYKLQNLNYFNMLSINFMDIYQNQLVLLLPNENEFEFCKEFLENSAQTLLYQQAAQLRKNMDKTIAQQLKVTSIAIDNLDKYMSIISLCPRSFLRKHRFIWYEEMCQILIDKPGEIKQVNQKMLQIQQTENIFIAEIGERILQYAYALEKNWLEADFNLKKSYDLMKTTYPEIKLNILNDCEEALLSFPASATSPKIILAALLSNLTGIINEFVIFEKTCQNSINDPYQYSPKLSDILEQQILFLTEMMKSTKIVYTLTNKQTAALQHMEAFNNLIQFVRSLMTMESILSIEIMPRILKLIMLEDNEITQILNEIIQIQHQFSFGSIMNNLNENINCESNINSMKEVFIKIRSHNQFYVIFNIIDKIFDETLETFIIAIKPLQELQEKCTFKFMDHICVAKEIMSRTAYPIEILQQQFEIIKIQIIIQIISTAFKLTNSLIENDLQFVYDFTIFQQIISNSINLFETNYLLGYGSYLGGLFETELLSVLGLEPITVKDTSNSEGLLFIAVQQNIAAGFFSVSNYSRAQNLCKQFLLTVKQQTLNDNLKNCIQLETYAVKHMQIISTVHFWLNEKLLLQQPIFGHILHKNIILQNFQGSLQSINGWQTSIETIREELTGIGIAISQRLKWAAGANQSLIGLQQSFEECHSKNNEKLKFLTEIINNISRNITTILSYEMIKFNNQKSDEEFLLLAKEYHKCWDINICTGDMINPVEKGIVQLLDPEGYIDHQWINNITGLLDEITDGVQSKIAYLEKDINQIHDNLQNGADKLRSLFDNELRIDIRYLLKLIFKIDNGHQVQRQKQFQINYKQFLNHISDLHVKILSRDFTQDNCRDIQKLIDTILIEINEIYEELMNLVLKGGGGGNNTYDNNEQNNNDGKSSGTPVREKKKGNQPEQKRNAYAVSVWRRIRMKLEGRDPDPNRRQTIPEQVDWMIREATNPDNLAVLYEGWTPWV